MWFPWMERSWKKELFYTLACDEILLPLRLRPREHVCSDVDHVAASQSDGRTLVGCWLAVVKETVLPLDEELPVPFLEVVADARVLPADVHAIPQVNVVILTLASPPEIHAVFANVKRRLSGRGQVRTLHDSVVNLRESNARYALQSARVAVWFWCVLLLLCASCVSVKRKSTTSVPIYTYTYI